jgi:hydroxymethylbilane synthase
MAFELCDIRTEGDRSAEAAVPLMQQAGRGVFVKDIEAQLLRGSIDLAVHSLKDMPSSLPPGLVIGAVPPRGDPRDVLVTRHGWSLAQLPLRARVGTSSLRRAAQLMHARPDLQVVPVRGNVDTRLRKLRESMDDLDALVLAAAGLERLAVHEPGIHPLDVELCTPQVGQGALAVEVRAADAAARTLCAAISDAPSERAARAERAFLRRLGGGCLAATGALAVEHDGTLEMRAVAASPDGRLVLREHGSGPASAPDALGERLADALLARGAATLPASASQG